jgi:two-component system cell cycle sensor histidine kinase/response regulator CckA
MATVKRALVVEDENCHSAIFCEVLESYGHEVVTAADGDSALNIANRIGRRLDLLLCDLGISGAAAHEVVRVVRMLHPQVRVVIITGSVNRT